MRAIPIDAADNEMDGCIHILKDAYMKNSAQEFIRMLSQSTSILANFCAQGYSEIERERIESFCLFRAYRAKKQRYAEHKNKMK